MDKDIKKGIKQGLGFFLVLSCIFAISAIGFHTADEILPGTFSGNYSFDGKIGIGTTNPLGKLHISTNEKSGIITNYRNGWGSYLQIYGSSDSYSYGGITLSNSSNIEDTSTTGWHIVYRKWPSEKEDFHIGYNNETENVLNGRTFFTIKNTGNIGIGTTTPQSKLHVNGILRVNMICDQNGNNCKDVSNGWT